MPTNIMMPEMGEGVVEGTVVTWLKHEGDDIREDEAVLEIETDKVTVEINAESDGVLLKACVNAGDTVPVGTVLAIVGNADENVAQVQTSSTVPQQATATPSAEEKNQPEIAKIESGSNLPTPTQPKTHKPAPSHENGEIRVSPVVARMVSEHSLDVSGIEGTGRNGRITKRDVVAYMDVENDTQVVDEISIEQSTTPTLSKQHTPVPEDANGELMPLSGMRRAIAEHMVMSKHTSPHATTIFEFDYTKVAKHRATNKAQFEKDGAKLTYMPYLIHAVAIALKNHPLVNSSWTDDGILFKREINIGIAVAVERGLIVPVIKQADSMNLLGIARALTDIAERARTNKLMPQDLQGGTFSITNHGASGSLIGTPIINQPQVGILGIGVIEKRVKVINDAIAIRPNAFVSFSFDHRVLDGATADAFVMDIKQHIENYA